MRTSEKIRCLRGVQNTFNHSIIISILSTLWTPLSFDFVRFLFDSFNYLGLTFSYFLVHDRLRPEQAWPLKEVSTLLFLYFSLLFNYISSFLFILFYLITSFIHFFLHFKLSGFSFLFLLFHLLLHFSSPPPPRP